MKKGFTLVEILVVIAIFAFLGILVARSIILTVGGSKKSESIIRVRENLDYAMGTIERQIRNANSLTTNCITSTGTRIDFLDQDGNPASFSCQKDSNGNGYVASGSAQLTSTQVNIIACSFGCYKSSAGVPSTVVVNLEGVDLTASGIQGADVSVTTNISLRNY